MRAEFELPICNVLCLIWGEAHVKAWQLGTPCTNLATLMSQSHLAKLPRRQTETGYLGGDNRNSRRDRALVLAVWLGLGANHDPHV